MQASFKIDLHKKDHKVLEAIRSYFGVGDVVSNGSDGIRFRISSIKGFLVLINHLQQYPLITKKQGGFYYLT